MPGEPLRHRAATARLWRVDGVVGNTLLHLIPSVEVPDALRVSAHGGRPENLYLRFETPTTTAMGQGSGVEGYAIGGAAAPSWALLAQIDYYL